MTRVARLNAVLDSMPPAVTGADADAWMGARLDQVRAAFSTEGASVTELYVLAPSPLVLWLAASGTLLRLEADSVVVEELDESLAALDNLGDDGFVLEVLTGDGRLDASLHRSLGLAPAVSLTRAELETRWVLQLHDKMRSSKADADASSL